jgi:hypothetical protein
MVFLLEKDGREAWWVILMALVKSQWLLLTTGWLLGLLILLLPAVEPLFALIATDPGLGPGPFVLHVMAVALPLLVGMLGVLNEVTHDAFLVP